jgi:hypothetical protein
LEDESKDDPSFFIVTYSETVTDGFDYEVPDDREVENPTGRLMVTVDVSFPCKVCGEGFVDKAGLR